MVAVLINLSFHDSFSIMYLSRIWVIAWSGERRFAWFDKSSYEKSAFVGGLLLYSFLTVIPVVGHVVTLLTVLCGAGTLILIKKELYAVLRNQELI